MSVAERNRLAAVRRNSSGNAASRSAITLRRSGAAQCSRWRVVTLPNRSRSSARFTRAAFSKPERLGCVSPRPMRVEASTNFVMPPGEKNSDGLTGRPKNMSSFE